MSDYSPVMYNYNLLFFSLSLVLEKDPDQRTVSERFYRDHEDSASKYPSK
jgi:hypothetical protein